MLLISIYFTYLEGGRSPSCSNPDLYIDFQHYIFIKDGLAEAADPSRKSSKDGWHPHVMTCQDQDQFRKGVYFTTARWQCRISKAHHTTRWPPFEALGCRPLRRHVFTKRRWQCQREHVRAEEGPGCLREWCRCPIFCHRDQSKSRSAPSKTKTFTRCSGSPGREALHDVAAAAAAAATMSIIQS